MTDEQPGSRIDVTLVAGGMYHDIDFARLELLKLLGEHEEFRVRVQPDYEDTDAITAGSILVSYTCNVRPIRGSTADDPELGRRRRSVDRAARHELGARHRHPERRRLTAGLPAVGRHPRLAVRRPPADHAVPRRAVERRPLARRRDRTVRDRRRAVPLRARRPSTHSSRCCTRRGRATPVASSNTTGPPGPTSTS